jgi:hypothetical protein
VKHELHQGIVIWSRQKANQLQSLMKHETVVSGLQTMAFPLRLPVRALKSAISKPKKRKSRREKRKRTMADVHSLVSWWQNW